MPDDLRPVRPGNAVWDARTEPRAVEIREHWVTGYIRELGGCGEVNAAEDRTCILDWGHEGRHGFDGGDAGGGENAG